MKVKITTNGVVTGEFFIDPAAERRRLQETGLPTALPNAMLRALEADNVGRMHQIAVLMYPALRQNQHRVIEAILSAPEIENEALIEITEAGPDWAICRRNEDGSWEHVLGPFTLPVLLEWKAPDTIAPIAIIHLPTATPEYFWTEIKNPGTVPWWRWMEAPIQTS